MAQQVILTTSGTALFDHNGMMLKLDIMDNTLSFSFGTPTVDESTKKRSYPKENRKGSILTLERAAYLLDKALPEIMNAYEDKRELSKGVVLNKVGSSILQLHTANGEVELLLFTDIDESRIPKNTYTFRFEKSYGLDNYNPIDGSFEKSESNPNFIIFYKMIEGFVMFSTNTAAHASRMTMKYTMDRFYNMLDEICKKLGVSVSNGYQRSNNFSTGIDEPLPFGDEPINKNESLQIDDANSLGDVLLN